MSQKVFLLADDDSDDRELFCQAIVSIDKNIICSSAQDGSEALNMIEKLEQKPNLVFLDVNMPVMNGWQCLKRLKEDERYKAIPVIMISTSSHQREMDIAADLGVLCYITKPNDFNQLKKVLQVIVANLGSGLKKALQDLQASGFYFVYVLTNE